MRSPKIEALKKIAIAKDLIDKCSTLTSGGKAVTCLRCGFINGWLQPLLYAVTIEIILRFYYGDLVPVCLKD